MKLRQGTFGFARHGGVRAGAGRKPKGEKAGVPHARRPKVSRHAPVHVTLRLEAGLPTLREPGVREVVHRVFAGVCDGEEFRIVHFDVQSNHLHLVVEAESKEALSRAMHSLCIRLAKALNKLWGRKGRVFADRYHARSAKSPREVRNVLVYVLHNARHHGVEAELMDPYGSGWWFDGYRENVVCRGHESIPPPVAKPRSWLLREGWKRHGLISIYEAPRAVAR